MWEGEVDVEAEGQPGSPLHSPPGGAVPRAISPASPASANASLAVAPADLIPILRAGAVFLKFHRSGSPAQRLVQLSANRRYIAYQSKKKSLAESSIAVEELVDVIDGAKFGNFRRFRDLASHRNSDNCFSIVYVRRDAKLDSSLQQARSLLVSGKGSVEEQAKLRKYWLDLEQEAEQRRADPSLRRTLDLLAPSSYARLLWTQGVRELMRAHESKSRQQREELECRGREGQRGEPDELEPVLASPQPSAPLISPAVSTLSHSPSSVHQVYPSLSPSSPYQPVPVFSSDPLAMRPPPFSPAAAGMAAAAPLSDLPLPSPRVQTPSPGNEGPGAPEPEPELELELEPAQAEQEEQQQQPLREEKAEEALADNAEAIMPSPRRVDPPLISPSPALAASPAAASSSSASPPASSTPPPLPLSPRPPLVRNSVDAPLAPTPPPENASHDLSPPASARVHYFSHPPEADPVLSPEPAAVEAVSPYPSLYPALQPSPAAAESVSRRASASAPAVPLAAPSPLNSPAPAQAPASSSPPVAASVSPRQSVSSPSPSPAVASPVPPAASPAEPASPSELLARALDPKRAGMPDWDAIMQLVQLMADAQPLVRQQLLVRSPLADALRGSDHAAGLQGLILLDSLLQNCGASFLRTPALSSEVWMRAHLLKMLPRWTRKPSSPLGGGVWRSLFGGGKSETKAERKKRIESEHASMALLRWNKIKVILMGLARESPKRLPSFWINECRKLHEAGAYTDPRALGIVNINGRPLPAQQQQQQQEQHPQQQDAKEEVHSPPHAVSVAVAPKPANPSSMLLGAGESQFNSKLHSISAAVSRLQEMLHAAAPSAAAHGSRAQLALDDRADSYASLLVTELKSVQHALTLAAEGSVPAWLSPSHVDQLLTLAELLNDTLKSFEQQRKRDAQHAAPATVAVSVGAPSIRDEEDEEKKESPALAGAAPFPQSSSTQPTAHALSAASSSSPRMLDPPASIVPASFLPQAPIQPGPASSDIQQQQASDNVRRSRASSVSPSVSLSVSLSIANHSPQLLPQQSQQQPAHFSSPLSYLPPAMSPREVASASSASDAAPVAVEHRAFFDAPLDLDLAFDAPLPSPSPPSLHAPESHAQPSHPVPVASPISPSTQQPPPPTKQKKKAANKLPAKPLVVL